MQRLNKTSLYGAVLFLTFSTNAFSQNSETFRTPAKMYAGAYTVKIQLKKDFTEYDVPVWIKPEVAESAMDPSLLKELGYLDKVIEFDEVRFSSEAIEKKNFKAQKTEWAFVPDFAKSCCFGVIGRDILQDFEIRFDPKDPSHLEWKRIVEKEGLPPIKPPFLAELKTLFSLTQSLDVPFILNLQERKLKLEYTPEKPQPTIFSFFFMPPDRVIQVTSVSLKNSASAKRVGFKSGLILTHINNEKVMDMDRWVIEKYLRGHKGTRITLMAKNKKEFTYDFTTHQFIPEEIKK